MVLSVDKGRLLRWIGAVRGEAIVKCEDFLFSVG